MISTRSGKIYIFRKIVRLIFQMKQNRVQKREMIMGLKWIVWKSACLGFGLIIFIQSGWALECVDDVYHPALGLWQL